MIEIAGKAEIAKTVMGDSEAGVLRFRPFELPDLGEEFVSESVVASQPLLQIDSSRSKKFRTLVLVHFENQINESVYGFSNCILQG